MYCVAFNKDGTLLASSSLDKTIRLWNPTDGKPIREIKGHTDIVDSVAFSPDGKLLASGSADKSVRLWNPADGKEVKNLGSHAKSVYCGRLQPRRQAAGQFRGRQPHQGLRRGRDEGTEAAQGPHRRRDRRRLHARQQGPGFHLAGSHGARSGTWPAGKEKKQIGTTDDDLYGIAFSRDGKALATSGYAGWLKVWTLDGTKVNDKPSFSQKLKAFGAYCVVFSPDGKSLVTGHDNKSILITPIGK